MKRDFEASQAELNTEVSSLKQQLADKKQLQQKEADARQELENVDSLVLLGSWGL